MPENARRARRKYLRGGMQRHVCNSLGIKVYFTIVGVRESFEQLGKRPLRAVPAIHERRNDGQPQLSAPVVCKRAVGLGSAGLAGQRRTAQRQRA